MANEVRVGIQNALPMQTVDDQHVHLHVGELNYLSQVVIFSSNLVKRQFFIQTYPNLDFHWQPNLDANGPIHYWLYENAVAVPGSMGTVIQHFNMNRNFTTSANVIFYSSPSTYAVSSFNLIYEGLLTGATGGGVGATAESPFAGISEGKFILNDSTGYLIVMQATAGVAVEAHFVSTFYEEG